MQNQNVYKSIFKNNSKSAEFAEFFFPHHCNINFPLYIYCNMKRTNPNGLQEQEALTVHCTL